MHDKQLGMQSRSSSVQSAEASLGAQVNFSLSVAEVCMQQILSKFISLNSSATASHRDCICVRLTVQAISPSVDFDVSQQRRLSTCTFHLSSCTEWNVLLCTLTFGSVLMLQHTSGIQVNVFLEYVMSLHAAYSEM